MATLTLPRSFPPSRAVSPWLLAVTVPLAAFMELLDTTIVNVAVEHIGGGLSSSTDEATYVLTSYLVANVIVLPLSGYLTGLFGRKNYYLWSVAIFTAASALCGIAPSLGLLVLFRILQGLGGGGLQPLSQAILMDAFPKEKRSTAQAVFSVTAVIAPALGPTVGGLLTDNASWRWVFLVNVPIGVIAFVLNSRLIQDPPHLTRFSLGERPFDSVGLSLLAVCLGSMQVVLDRGQIEDWLASPLIATFAVCSVVSLVLLVRWELRHPHPVVDLRLLMDRNFSLSVMAMFAMGLLFYAANYMQPLYCQQLLGWTATWAGFALSPGAIVFIAMMPIMPALIRTITPRYMILAGFIVHGLACLLMAGWSLHSPFTLVLGTRIFEVAGLAWLMVPINVMAFSFLQKEKITSGSGLLSLARNFGASCGVSLAATLLARRAQFHQSRLVEHVTASDASTRQALQKAAEMLFHHGMAQADAARASLALVGREVARQASALSYVDAFWLLALGSFLAAPLVLLIRRREKQASDSGQTLVAK